MEIIGKKGHLKYSGGSTWGDGIIQKCYSPKFKYQIETKSGKYRFNQLKTPFREIII